MERKILDDAKELFGNNFIGGDEIIKFFKIIGLNIENISIPEINYSLDLLKQCSKDYILILGFSKINNESISIRFLRERFGVDPDLFEPCFYNQDWYLNERFIDNTLENRWYLIKKNIIEESRAVQPQFLLDQQIHFPSVTLCTYTFFAYYFQNNEFLWHYDFIWCNDVDHNGDRVYVGKYLDIDGVNKNGFSIHRHLALRECYGSVDEI